MKRNDGPSGGSQHTAARKMRNLSLIVIAVGLVPIFGLLYAGNQVSALLYYGTLAALVVTVLLFAAIALEPRLILHRSTYRDYDEQ